MSNSLQLQGLQHARLSCPSPSPRVCSNSCPLRQWCHPTTSSFVIPLLLLSSIFPRIRVFSNDLALHIRCCILCLGCIQKMRTEAHPYCKQYSLVCVLILHCVNVICTNTKVFSKVTRRCEYEPWSCVFIGLRTLWTTHKLLLVVTRWETQFHKTYTTEIKKTTTNGDLIKFISFFTANETTNKMKRQPIEREKIFANDGTNNGLISKIYKQFIQFNNKNQTT